MTTRVATLNSSSPFRGTKPYDSEIDITRTHFSCAGRLPHPQHEAYANGVCELSGSSIIVNESSWLVQVDRPGNLPPYTTFNVLFQVTSAEQLATTGDGTVIARVYSSAVAAGAVTSNDGLAEGKLEFISGSNLTDAQIDTATSGDFWVRVCDFSGGVITQGQLAQLTTPGGLKLDGGTIDMGTGCITNMKDGMGPTDAVTLSQVQQMLMNSGGGGFTLTGSRSGTSAPRVLNWDDVMNGTGGYDVQRSTNGGLGWTTIATLGAGTTTYTDGAFVTGVLTYRVLGSDTTTGYNVFSNWVQFNGTTVGVYACGDYGDGSGGAYTGGDLAAGQLYQFASFDLISNMSFTGTGDTLIFVQNDLNMTAGAITLPYATAATLPTVEVCGSVQTLATSGINPNNGGQGGSGGQPAITGQPFGQQGGKGGSVGFMITNPGQDGTINPAGFGAGGASGTVGSPNGQDGQAGWPQFVPPTSSTAQPGGGGAGGHGLHRSSLVFVVGGNVTVDGASTIIGFGANGGDGGNGGYGTHNQSGQGAPGGGGGGAGGQGGDGASVVIFHPTAATVAVTPVLQLNGGQGGAGGTDGPGGLSIASGQPTQAAPSGFAGQNGFDGAAGALATIAV